VLAGFIRPDAGSVRFGEQEVVLLPPHKRGIGMVFQNYALFPHMDVAGNVGYPLGLRGIKGAEQARLVQQALATVQLEGLGARRVDQLSGGQRQRVALARAIVFAPRIVLMDEPLSALDKQLRERMQIELRQLHEQLGTTTLYVTHDQREALTLSDRIAVINGGRIMQLGSPREIYEQPANRFVAEFIGESSFLPVQLSGSSAHCEGQPLRLPRAAPRAGAGTVMLRPERVRVLPASGAAAAMAAAALSEQNRLDARIRHLIFQGDSVLVQATLGADGGTTPMEARVGAGAAAAALRVGEAVQLVFDIADTVVLADERA
jgi:putative spermidine/putrescine transport system ATP-binding protein